MRRALALAAAAAMLAACDAQPGQSRPHSALFVGLDVSGSFFHSRYYADSLDFLSQYLYGHLNGLGGLQKPKELFVGPIGGGSVVNIDVKAFHPIQDFQGKTAEQIRSELQRWYGKEDKVTDYNTFFREVAAMSAKRNLSLMPITVVLLTDGIPDLPAGQHVQAGDFAKIDFSPLEYLSRNVTVRVLYLSPNAADKWETVIPRNRVRLWTAVSQVMAGWKSQLKADAPPEQQRALWSWIADNVDFRVRNSPLRLLSRR